MQGGAGGQEGAVQVDVDDPAPILVGGVVEQRRVRVGHAGIGDKDIKAAIAGDCLRHGGLDPGLVGHVGMQGQGFGAKVGA